MRPKPYPQVAYYDWATAEAAELDPAQWSIKARRRGRRFHSRGVPPPYLCCVEESPVGMGFSFCC